MPKTPEKYDAGAHADRLKYLTIMGPRRIGGGQKNRARGSAEEWTVVYFPRFSACVRENTNPKRGRQVLSSLALRA